MKRPWEKWPILLGWLVGMVAPAAAQPLAGGRAPHVAIVTDGPSDFYRRTTSELKNELTALLTGRFANLQLPDAPTHVGDFTEQGTRAQLDAALADPSVDVVVGFGVITGRLLGGIQSLPKPCFLPFAHAALQGLPRDGARSGRHNLGYLTGLVDLDRDLRRFREVIRRDRAVIVVDSHILNSVPGLDGHVQEWAGDEMQVRIVPAGASAAGILEALPADAEAVYLGIMVQLPDSEVGRLLAGLNARKLPTYASQGRDWVQRGAFVSLVPDDEEQRRLRKVALNIDEALSGTDPADMLTTFERHSQLTINMRTARQIQVWPRFELMTEAELIGEAQDDTGETLTLRAAVEEAVRANRDLAAQRAQIEVAKQEYRESKGEVAPRVEGDASFQVIPENAVFPLLNSESALTVRAEATQMVYSPAVVGGLRSRRYAVKATTKQVKVVEMDITQQAAEAYLNVLRARTAEQINRDFLARVRQNLSMAEVRVEIGASGRQDAFRWQIEIADARVNVLSSSANSRKAEIALNRALNRPLEHPMQTVDPMNSEDGIIVDEQLRQLVNDPWSFAVFREFMAQEAIRRSPEVAQLDAAIRSREEVLKALRARLYLPDLFIRGGVSQVLGRWGRGAEQGPSNPGDPRRQDFQWNVGAIAQMKLFDMTRYAEVDKNRAELVQLRAQRASIVQGVEQRVRSETHNAGVTSSAMQLRKDAAEAARHNLELVTDAYRTGTVDIITLVDAQNQALSSDLRAANAVYDFLIDFVRVERAAGWFGFMQDAADRQAFVTRLLRFYQERRGGDPTAPEGTR